jgi:ATP-binding cassette subfamily F protein uup
MLRLRDIRVSFGSYPLLDGLSLTIDKGERIALVGRNGTGKSTLLKVLAGEIQPEDGLIETTGHVCIARLEQDVPETGAGTLFDLVATGLGEAAPLLSEYEALTSALTHESDERILTRLDHIQKQLDAADGWRLQQRVETLLTRLQLDGHDRFTDLSGGTKRRALLAKALVAEPDLLLLDEPTNHLDIDTIEWLEANLLQFPGSLLFVSHDRAFVRKMATRIIDLDRGYLSDWPGDYDNYLRRKQEALDAEAAEQARFDKKLAQEEIWIRQGIKARRTRNEGRVRALKQLRQEYAQRRYQPGKVVMAINEAESSGRKVIEANHICYTVDGKPLIHDFSTLILRGDRIGIIGRNGIGKSTLLRILLGKLRPDSGEITQGTQLQVAYFDQLRQHLDENRTVRDNLAEGSDSVTINGQSKHVIGYLQDFLFTPDRANTPVRALSGGEKNRLLLARLFSLPSNLLVLDEPTNDLDMETLELLEEQIADYPGTLLLVSHDRDFLNRVVTSTLVFEGDGRIGQYVGGYDDWLRQRQASPAKPATEDKPSKTKTDKPVPAAQPAPQRAKKLSFKDARELESLPARIEALEAEQAQLQQRQADPQLYQQGSDAVQALQTRLAQIDAELCLAYARWEELEG